jgi:hypothetical protein
LLDIVLSYFLCNIVAGIFNTEENLGTKMEAQIPLPAIIGIILACILVLAGILLFRVGEKESSTEQFEKDIESKSIIEREIKSVFDNIEAYIPQSISVKHILVAMLLGLIILTTLFGKVSIFGFELGVRNLLVLYFLLVLIWKLDSRISIAVALFLLLLCPIFLIGGDEYRANIIATSAFAFLVIGVLFQLVEYLKERPQEDERAALEKEKLSQSAEIPEKPRVKTQLITKVREISQQIPEHFRKRKIVGSRIIQVGSLIIVLSLGVFFVVKGRQAEKPLKHKIDKFKTEATTDKLVGKQPVREQEIIDENKVKVQVLNKNGVESETEMISALLKQKGFDVISMANLDTQKNARTIIRYKAGKKNIANSVAKEIAKYYPATLAGDLGDNEVPDIVVALGKDKIGGFIDKSKFKIEVQNGSGVRGAARETAGLLTQNGFSVTGAIELKKQNFSQTLILYRPGNQEAAQAVADQIKEKYTPVLQQSASIKMDIVVILGKK